MRIIYRPHLKRRIKERKFPQNYPKDIYKNAKILLFDNQTQHHIAISKMKYAGRVRNLAISYDIIGNNIEIITIHPVSEKEIRGKIRNKRWQKI